MSDPVNQIADSDDGEGHRDENAPPIPDADLRRVLRAAGVDVTPSAPRADLVARLDAIGLPIGSEDFEDQFRLSNEEIATKILQGLEVVLPGEVTLDYDLADPSGPNYGGALVSVRSTDEAATTYGTLWLVVSDSPVVAWVGSVWDSENDQLPETTLEDPASEQGRAILSRSLQEIVRVVSSATRLGWLGVIKSGTSSLRVKVKAIVDVLTDPDDAGVEGMYTVHFDGDRMRHASLNKQASAALDVFHSKVGIDTLDDFEIDVIDEAGEHVEQDEDHDNGSCADAGDVEKINGDPLEARDA